MDRNFPRVRADTDQERAASLALHHGVDALPVVDADGRPLGVMPSQALLQVLRREHVEDLHRLAGIQREASQARHAIEDPPLRRMRHRLPWLLVGLAGSAIATAAMAGFEATLRASLTVAFFVPGIVYLADAIGTQSEAIAVRRLSLTRAGIVHLLAGELRTGMLLGAVLGLAASCRSGSCSATCGSPPRSPRRSSPPAAWRPSSACFCPGGSRAAAAIRLSAAARSPP